MKRILVADDDPANAELLTYFLRENGFEVETADDGNRAIDLGTSGKFALVIMDYHMPIYDGREVIELLHKRHMLHPIKVIVLTADDSDATRAELQRAGIDSFLTKPINLSQLREEINRLLAA